ncbi:MAG: alanine dehydrogenase [Thiotrichales bacterium]|nr:MAG: alanine dehydrogenase [Thiotrichales bacterium]
MIIGVPKEIKAQEFRVGLTPASVRELIKHGHKVLVETNAGDAIGFTNAIYEDAGATITQHAKDIFAKSELIIKVKEPQTLECRMLRQDQTIFTFLHLAADKLQTELLIKSKCTAIAYETVTDNNGGLPLLAPMSEVAGRMSVQAGAHCLEKINGGRGVLLGGVPGVAPANVVIIGGGVAGSNAIRIALGMGANVTVLDISIPRLQLLDTLFAGKINTIYSTADSIEAALSQADLVIGAVLIPGAKAPKIISRELLRQMPKGAVMVDIAIDQGGCAETSRATTHNHPTYIEENIVHYCVANIPGAVARTSTMALNNATLHFILQIANLGTCNALLQNEHLLHGLNIHNGNVVYEPVACALSLPYTKAIDSLQTASSS